jgi:hypothetical protein
MFCPKCGSQTVEGQRFCKTCGTNVQLISDAIKGGGPQAPFGIDVEALTRNAKEFAESWKRNWNPKVVGVKIDQQRVDSIRARREARRRERDEARRQNLPKPREYMSYSWQHNLRSGLVSLFWGSGLGIILYYLGRTLLDNGLIQQIEATGNHIQGLEPLVRMIWLIALLPVLKGLARIIYAAFFGESMATLTERFTPHPALLEQAPAYIRHDTAPVGQPEAVRAYDDSREPPPSVTEHTTHIFEETQPQAKRETQ